MLALSTLMLLPALVAAQQMSLIVPNLSNCSANSTYSCQNTTAVDTCCSPYPGGLVLATQFWDTYTGLESSGQFLPSQSWTIHGLWPDFCNGSYTSYCDLSRQYDPYPSPNKTSNGTAIPAGNSSQVVAYLEQYGYQDLLAYMSQYWVNQGGPNQDFWAHEFSKHATCSSTFDTRCFSNYTAGQDVVSFYKAAVRAYQRFPTYDMLAARGIVPSNTTRYNYTDILAALTSQTNAVPYIGCSNRTILSEVWYNGHVGGSEQFGTWMPVDSPAATNCNISSGIWYYERTSGSEQQTNITSVKRF